MDIKLIKKEKTLEKAKIHVNPAPYWKFTLLISSAVLLLGCVFGFYLFTKTNADFSLNEGGKSSVETINKKGLEDSLKYFEDKKQKTEGILVNPSPVTDPSI